MKQPLDVSEFRFKLYPKDFDKARAFYATELKLLVIKEWDKPENNRGVMFDVGGTTLELLTRNRSYEPVAGADLSLEVGDVWKLYEEIKNKEYVTRGLRDNDWGDTSFQITDPEGLVISLFTKHSDSSNPLKSH